MKVIITIEEDDGDAPPKTIERWEGLLEDAPDELMVPEDAATGYHDYAEADHLRAAIGSLLQRQSRVAIRADQWRGTLLVQRAEPLVVFVFVAGGAAPPPQPH